jgi:DNA-binding CsgD family transcriptional regulator
MLEPPTETLRSGDALFAFTADLSIVSWNRAAEALTGVCAEDAVGRKCWDVLGGHDDRGNLICHAACSTARLAGEGWPVPCQDLLIRAWQARRRVALSTVAVDDDDRPLILHIMVPRCDDRPGRNVPVSLTPRQQQVLGLLGDGVPAKVIATRLGLAEATARNHIRAILAALETHSQLEAIAKARRLQLIT